MSLKKASQNIFKDLGFTDAEAEDLRYRSELLLFIRKICDKEGFSRRDLEKLLDVPQPRVSELMTGKIDRISADKMFSYIQKLGYKVELKLKRA